MCVTNDGQSLPVLQETKTAQNNSFIPALAASVSEHSDDMSQRKLQKQVEM